MSKRLLLGIGLLVAAAAIIAAVTFMGGDEDSNDDSSTESNEPQMVTVTGFTGSEKTGFFDNPDIQQILEEKYQLRVDYTKAGSIEMVETDSSGMDFLWPSNEVALALYEERNPSVKSETIFNSPIVMYSWSEVTEVLMEQGIVELVDGTYYVVNMPELVNFILEGQTWEDVGLPELFGQVKVISTDPTKSNSGNMFYGLLANLLVGGEVANDQTIEEVLPTLKSYYDSLGLLQEGSGDLFKQFVNRGVGEYPIIVGYESQLIEFTVENPQNVEQIRERVNVLYPRPTVWSSHPVIALTDNGERLMLALQDPDIQQIAWEVHGFRSGGSFAGVDNSPGVLLVGGIPEQITAVLNLPRPSAMARMNNYLATGQ
jgi:hypothetical protein